MHLKYHYATNIRRVFGTFIEICERQRPQIVKKNINTWDIRQKVEDCNDDIGKDKYTLSMFN